MPVDKRKAELRSMLAGKTTEELEELLNYSYHHTFSDYINAIIHHGLTILEMQEPLPPESGTQGESVVEIPSYLIIKLQKT